MRIEEYLKQTSAPQTNNGGSSTPAPAASNPVAFAAPSTADIAQDFQSDTTNIHEEAKAQEEKEKKEKKQTNNSNLPVWMQTNSYESDDEDRDVTEEDVSKALNDIVQFELSEKDKEDTIYYSDKYSEGLTHNGKVVNGSCTEGGMKKAILGDYITVTKAVDDDGDGVADRNVEMRGVEAMAAENDSVLDLLTRSKFKEVLADYGYGTFSNNCNFIKHADEIREKYGIDIKEVPTEGPDGVAHRTYEISLVDENGNIIEDTEGNKSTILFGDWVIPDGCAQGAEIDFISVIDQAGFGCVSEADFINNEAFASDPAFQDENGNYDPSKAYAYVISQLEGDFESMRNGQGQGQYMKAGNTTIADRTFTTSKFEWWSKGGGDKYYQNSGLDSSLLGDISSELKQYDLNNDGTLDKEEMDKLGEKQGALEEEKDKKASKDKKEADAQDVKNASEASAKEAAKQAKEYKQTVEDATDYVEKLMDKNPDMTLDEAIEKAAKDEGVKERDLEKAL